MFSISSVSLRRLLQQEIYSIYQNSENRVIVDYKRDSEEMKVKVYPKRLVDESNSDKKDQEAKKKTPYEEVVDSISNLSLDEQQEVMKHREMGFTEVILALIDSKKPIIGHNMCYDVAYLYQMFIEDLPETYL